MAFEPKRGCGFRKVGGLYLVGGKLSDPCCKLPFALDICPTCAGGVKQARGWSWIDARPWLKGLCKAVEFDVELSRICPAANPDKLGERVGLLWVGTKYYPTPEHFTTEGATLGISKRLSAVPRGFEVGRDWVLMAHPLTLIASERKPGAFAIFRPLRIEKIVTQTQSQNDEAMADLRKRGITPVIVPDDDRDHQGDADDEDDASTTTNLIHQGEPV